MKSLLVFIALGAALFIACSASKSASNPEAPLQLPTTTQSGMPVATSSVTEKSVCNLKLSELPVIKGLKLGTTPDEVLALFPGSKDDLQLRTTLSTPPGPTGDLIFAITPSKYSGAGAEFKDVTRLSFGVLDGRIWKFTINYNGPEWEHVDKFVEKFIENKTLPAVEQWEPYVGMDQQMKTLTCADFSVRIFAGGEGGNLNYVLVQDLEAEKKLKERRRKAREQASPTPEQ